MGNGKDGEMHYDREYVQQDDFAKRDAAIADCKEYLGGEAEFERLCTMLKTAWEGEVERPELRHVQMALSFVGIQGYPTKAIYEHIWPL